MGAARWASQNDARPFTTSASAQQRATVPVTVLSGFLGAGKTTLLNHILSDKQHGARIAVLVNDMAEINIDADLIRNAGDDNHGMVQLENGCICCTLQNDLVIELAKLAQEGGLDHIIVESTGISEPHPVAQTFSTPIASLACSVPQDKDGDAKRAALVEATAGLGSLQDAAHLHSLVTVVDCATFVTHLHSLETLHELDMSSVPGDERPLAFLLAEQVQFANLLLLNKTDLVSPAESQKVAQILALLNPSAQIVRTERSAIDVSSLLGERKYDEKEFVNLPGWEEELAKGPHSEAEEYGIGHFTVSVLGRPFHADRAFAFLHNEELLDGVLRAKGCFWTREEADTRVDFSLVGHTAELVVDHVWVEAGMKSLCKLDNQAVEVEVLPTSACTESVLPDFDQDIQRLQKEAGRLKEASLWHPVTHDRRIELVFIGDKRMQQDRIRAAADAAMLTQEELREFLDSWGTDTRLASRTQITPNPFANVPGPARGLWTLDS